MPDGSPLVLHWLHSHLVAHAAAVRVGLVLGLFFAAAVLLSPHVKSRRR